LKLCHAIEKSYKYYRDQRHGLFHIDSTIETTRVISNRSDANNIIEKTFEIIEQTYTSIIT